MTAPEDKQKKLPELNDAVLSNDELSDLFRDYRECTTINEILIKSNPGLVSTETRPSLDHAEDVLRTRSVRGVQIRYQFELATWCDTLMPTATGVRLVRIRQPA